MNFINRHTLLSKYTLLVTALVLFALSFIFSKLYTHSTSVAREGRLAEKYIRKQQEDFSKLLHDTTLLRKLVDNRESLTEFQGRASRDYVLCLYSADEFGGVKMNFWSDQLVVPPQEFFSRDDGEYFTQLANGFYVVVKDTRALSGRSDKIISFALIPVQSKIFIETEYVPEKFYFSNTAINTVLITTKVSGYPVRSVSGQTLFFLDRKITSNVPYNDRLTIFLRLIAVFVLLVFIHLYSESIADKRGPWIAVAFMAAALLLLRIISYQYPLLLNLRQFELFNPAIYGSNVIQRSLGDLLINAVLFAWIVLFAWSKLHHIPDPGAKLSNVAKAIAGFLSLVLLILSTFVLSSVIRSMVADSHISFDVTDFFSLNKYTVIGFFVLACLSLAYYYFTQLLFRFIFPLFHGRTIVIYFVIAAAGLVYLTTRSGDPTVLFFLPVLLWLLLYTFLIQKQGIIITQFRINMAGILIWIVLFSVSISAIMLAENKKVEWERRKTYVDKMVVQTDESSERLLRIAMAYLDNDFLSSNFERFKSESQNKYLRDSIIGENYAGYLNKYDTYLYLYDSSGNPLYNDDNSTYDALNTIITVQSRPAATEGLYYYESDYDKFAYITKREIRAVDSAVLGYLFVVSNPKKYSSDALFPELFKRFKKNDPETSPIYSSAYYVNGKLYSSLNTYPFATSIREDQIPKQEFERRTNGDFDELWYRASTNTTVVMARKRDTIVETITLFSYIFCSFLFMVAIVQLLSLLLKVLYKGANLKRMFQLSIRNQVHSTIIFISIFSFLIIGVSTISFFINRYKRNNNEKLSRTMTIMVKEMQKKLSDHSTFDDMVKLYDSISGPGLQNLVNEVSGIHGVDVNVYDLNGNLYVSSAPNVYTRGVLSKKMEPTAYYYLNRRKLVQHAQDEKIGDLSYLSIYAPVRDDNRDVYAYLNIPYFTSQPELNLEISNFLVTMINLNAFIFLIAGLIALFITNRITRSFSIISSKMKEVSLGQMNEEITWNREDEIGGLVKEYNKMVAKLGESAVALAKSEREGAWREMARQVAHEIKNPLTPMKLSIQYLQKAIDNNQPNVKELSANVADTLVEQIDHLSKIAADFSQFANIGNISSSRFNLHDVIASLRDLYRPDEHIEFTWKPVDRPVMIVADKTQMNRLFTNLFTNAIDACFEKDKCRILVEEEVTNDMIRISITDNGEGIPPEMQERIFSPNFTTKTSGTGLGLAMCKGIVEQAKGRIWFETEVNVGTTFFVELPLA